ncbi:hypothetical protein [Streptomyces macrosporus]|uniref:Uncharacterized protein n=1 Tax=Streptomyces macrosporus TaxID=44032 RepID=A0ABN3KEF9_9ACTN
MYDHDWADEPHDDQPDDGYAQALAEDGYSPAQQRRIVQRGEAA